MAIVNLGQFGPQRESNFSGLSDALLNGMKVGEAIRSNKATERTNEAKLAEEIRNNKTNAYMDLLTKGMLNDNEQSKIAETERNNRATEDIAREKVLSDRKTLTTALAKQKFDEEQKHRENVMKTIEQYSLSMNDKKPQDQEMFKSTDHYKELQKLVKSYAPEFIDDNGDIIPLQNKDIYETQLSKVKATNAQILAGGGKLSSGQQRAQDLLDQVDPKLVAIALDNASKDPAWIGASAQEQGQMVSNNLQYLVKGRGSLRNSGSEQVANPMSSALGDDSKDPLGLFSR